MRHMITWQIKNICSRKVPYFTFLFLFGYVIANFITNVFQYSGRDVAEMYMPMYFLTLSAEDWSFNFFFMEYFPFLVVLPAAFSYLKDRSSREVNYLAAKIGRKNYYLSKGIAVFLVTFAIFSIPFLLEIILNCIAFPLNAVGHPHNFNNYQLMKNFEDFFWLPLFQVSPYLYAVVFTFIFGMVSGVLAVFAVAISMLGMRFKVFVFVPCYLLLNGIFAIQAVCPVCTYYGYYFSIFDSMEKSGWAYLLVVLLVAAVSFGIIFWKGRRDCLC